MIATILDKSWTNPSADDMLNRLRHRKLILLEVGVAAKSAAENEGGYFS